MAKQASYEKIISGKLEELTIPDSADAIWERIRTTLDLEMPTDEDPGSPSTGPTGGRGPWKLFGLSVFVAALIAAFYFIYPNSNSTIQTQDIPADTLTTISDPDKQIERSPPARSVTTAPPFFSPGSNSITSSPVTGDSIVIDNVDRTSQTVIDPASTGPPVAPPPLVIAPADTVQKKSRGVRGISDGDYRIVPKKDSQ